MVLNKNPENYFNEVEQAAFGTGVLVDGLDFSDDKMLQGRTFSYSDTQRYRVGTNYLQLPINAPKKRVATNQRGGQMSFYVDTAPGQNPHVNYEPSVTGGLKEAEQIGKIHEPHYNDKLVRETIDRPNDFGQAGDTYRSFEDWEREELISNLVDALSVCRAEIQNKMIEYFTNADKDYGKQVKNGLAKAMEFRTDTSHTSTVDADEATNKSRQMGHEADPY
jgi:catalase